MRMRIKPFIAKLCSTWPSSHGANEHTKFCVRAQRRSVAGLSPACSQTCQTAYSTVSLCRPSLLPDLSNGLFKSVETYAKHVQCVLGQMLLSYAGTSLRGSAIHLVLCVEILCLETRIHTSLVDRNSIYR